MYKGDKRVKEIIDISKGRKNSYPEIIFYEWHLAHHSHSNANKLVRSSLHHEGHYGLTIANSRTTTPQVYIETKENAEKLIEALQLAISSGWLFSEKEIDNLRHSVCTTLEQMIQYRAEANHLKRKQ